MPLAGECAKSLASASPQHAHTIRALAFLASSEQECSNIFKNIEKWKCRRMLNPFHRSSINGGAQSSCGSVGKIFSGPLFGISVLMCVCVSMLCCVPLRLCFVITAGPSHVLTYSDGLPDQFVLAWCTCSVCFFWFPRVSFVDVPMCFCVIWYIWYTKM